MADDQPRAKVSSALRRLGPRLAGRFKAFPIEEVEHLLTVLRYVERNPVRANLVSDAAEWSWSSLGGRDAWLDPGPVPRGLGWAEWVHQPQTDAELQAMRRAVNRGTPFGSPDWQQRTATASGLESTLRPRGRPRLAQTSKK